MEKIAALVAQKQKKIEELEKVRVEKEQAKDACEIQIEDLQTLISQNKAELQTLLENDNVFNGLLGNVNSFITKYMLALLIVVILASTVSLYLIPVFALYTLYKIPAFVKLVKEIKSFDSIDLQLAIKDKKDTIDSLEKEKDRLISLLKVIEYSLIDVDTERSVTEDTLNFVLNSKSFTNCESYKTFEDKRVRTRVNTAI